MRSVWLGVPILAALVGLGVLGYQLWPPPPPSSSSELPPTTGQLTNQAVEESPQLEAQLQHLCGVACHAYPPPNSYPRRFWRKEVEQAYRFYEKSGMSLNAPPIDTVVQYFEKRAPEEYPANPPLKSQRPLSLRFQQIGYPGPDVPGKFAISHVQIVPDSIFLRPTKTNPPVAAKNRPKALLACDMKNGLILHLRLADEQPAWKVLARVPHPAMCRVVDLDGDGLQDLLVADLGNFTPTDLACGSVVWLRGKGDGTFQSHTLLFGVGRVADVSVADFSGTGKLDLVVASFGWQSAGELVLLENKTTDWNRPRFVTRVLDPRHGAIHVPVADLNGDGKPDFVALFAQEHEQIVGFINQGGGKFRKETVYAGPHPGYGSSGIELVDLNRDGRLDILYTNGDVLDSPYLFKPFHSVQWLENLGQGKFKHHAVAPMFGVHRAVAGDLFGTGHLAIAAVSFLPADYFKDRAARNPPAIVLFEQTAPGKFDPHVLAETECDHVTCVVGDLYGTGRLDLVVGHFVSPTVNHPVTVWKNVGPKP